MTGGDIDGTGRRTVAAGPVPGPGRLDDRGLHGDRLTDERRLPFPAAVIRRRAGGRRLRRPGRRSRPSWRAAARRAPAARGRRTPITPRCRSSWRSGKAKSGGSRRAPPRFAESWLGRRVHHRDRAPVSSTLPGRPCGLEPITRGSVVDSSAPRPVCQVANQRAAVLGVDLDGSSSATERLADRASVAS